MPDQLFDQFNRLPAIIWDAILAAIAIILGLIVKFMLSLLLRRKPGNGRPHFSVTL
jgi:ABC-type sugar transport system permease subunit